MHTPCPPGCNPNACSRRLPPAQTPLTRVLSTTACLWGPPPHLEERPCGTPAALSGPLVIQHHPVLRPEKGHHDSLGEGTWWMRTLCLGQAGGCPPSFPSSLGQPLTLASESVHSATAALGRSDALHPRPVHSLPPSWGHVPPGPMHSTARPPGTPPPAPSQLGLLWG